MCSIAFHHRAANPGPQLRFGPILFKTFDLGSNFYPIRGIAVDEWSKYGFSGREGALKLMEFGVSPSSDRRQIEWISKNVRHATPKSVFQS